MGHTSRMKVGMASPVVFWLIRITRMPTLRPFLTRSSTSRAFSAVSAASRLVVASLPLYSRKYVCASS